MKFAYLIPKMVRVLIIWRIPRSICIDSDSGGSILPPTTRKYNPSMLRDQEMNKGYRFAGGSTARPPVPTLADVGITKSMSSRAQKIIQRTRGRILSRYYCKSERAGIPGTV